MRVSVIIPTYNYAQYISIAIESILVQECLGVETEIIIADDGSKDDTVEIVRKYGDRVRYHYQENQGKANATRKAVDLATGKYIFNLDADDYFLPNKIAKSVEIFEKSDEVVHVSSPAAFVREDVSQQKIEPLPTFLQGKTTNGHKVLEYFYRNRLLFGGGSTFAARTDILKKIDIPDDVDMYIDEYLLLAVLPYGDSYFFEEPLSVWRIHGKNYSGQADLDKIRIKQQRLLNSSLGVLNALPGLALNKEIMKIYELQHQVRTLAAKEELGEKNLDDIFTFLRYILGSGLSFEILKNQTAINRLIPTSLLYRLKKLKLS
jgi:glycosyltransferase involved in cell wall biosynthesis